MKGRRLSLALNTYLCSTVLIGSGLFLRSWLISHSRFRTNTGLEDLQVSTFVSKFLISSDHLVGREIGMGLGPCYQPRRPPRTPFKGQISHLSLGHPVQSAYENRLER